MNNRLAYIARTKLKVVAGLLGIVLAVVATVSFAGLPLLPTLGVAVAAAAVSIRKMADRLAHPTCLACGHDLRREPAGTHGIACPECGAVNMPWKDGRAADAPLPESEDSDDAMA
ncbi:MAG: hypothetical protein AB7G11_16390 [Phycisphaerales bacterium]